MCSGFWYVAVKDDLMKNKDMQHSERTERMMVNWICGTCLENNLSGKELNVRFGVTDVVKQGRLRWFGHMDREGNNN